jgi:hypothetical protein
MKPNKLVILVMGAMVLMVGGQLSTPIQRTSLQEQIAQMQRRGYAVKFLDNNLVETTEPITGDKRVKSLNEPSEAEIRSSAARRGIPILEIDPRMIDTNRYSGWYRHWSTIPLSNGSGEPLLVRDYDRDGKPEAYGIYHERGVSKSNVYEIDSSGAVELVYEFLPRVGQTSQATDVDGDSLWEVNYQFGDSAYNYEQTSSHSLPTRRNFVHQKYVFGGAIRTRERIANLDGDSFADFLYRGSEGRRIDSVRYATYVAEFDMQANNFQRVWSLQLSLPFPESSIGGYEVNDFDTDGRTDFVASSQFGQVWVVENTGNNLYEVAWRASLPFSNLLYQGSGDIDGNGKPISSLLQWM